MFVPYTLYITRPAETVDSFLLKNKNVQFLPIMRYIDFPLTLQDVEPYQHLIFTSQYAALLYLQNGFPKKKAYCVGAKTAKVIQGIYPKQTGVQYLIDFICEQHNPLEPLLYLSGEIIKHPLDTHLQELGFVCHKKIIYKTEPIVQDLSVLPENFCVVFYSRQTYLYFMDLVHVQKMHSHIKKAIAIFVNPHPSTSIFLNEDTLHWKKILSFKDTQDVLSFIQGDLYDTTE